MNDPNKSYELSFDERPDYLYALIKSETIDRERAIQYLSEVAARCKELEVTSLLLERDIPVMLPDADLFFTTQDFVKMSAGVRIAFVNTHITNDEAMKFAIMIGTNRGARFDVFNTVEAAERWLLNVVGS